jgi:hypothetical protein
MKRDFAKQESCDEYVVSISVAEPERNNQQNNYMRHVFQLARQAGGAGWQ